MTFFKKVLDTSKKIIPFTAIGGTAAGYGVHVYHTKVVTYKGFYQKAYHDSVPCHIKSHCIVSSMITGFATGLCFSLFPFLAYSECKYLDQLSQTTTYQVAMFNKRDDINSILKKIPDMTHLEIVESDIKVRQKTFP